LKAISRQPPAASRSLEQLELARIFLEEKVDDAIAVDIDELRPRMLEAAKKRQRVGSAGGV